MYRILLVTLLIAVLPAAGRENRVAGSAAPALEAEDEPARHTLLDHAAGVGFRIDLPAAATPPAAPKARGPMRIGFHRDVPMAWQGDLLPRLDWTPLGNGTVAAALWVSSPEAISIRVGRARSLTRRRRGAFLPSRQRRCIAHDHAGRFPLPAWPT